MAKGKVLIVGGSGYLGRRMVKASLDQGRITYILLRPETARDIDKLQILLAFKQQGEIGRCCYMYCLWRPWKLLRKLVMSRYNQDFIPTVGFVSCVDNCFKKGNNIQRFLPSEFGTDPTRMDHAMEAGKATFADKMVVRKAIEEAKIPFTYISANCFAGYFLAALCQFGRLTPPMDSVVILGDGNVKAIYVDEYDIATYTIKTIDDPQTLNKTIYLRPPENILSQREIVAIWEKHIGKELEKSSISEEDFLAQIEGMENNPIKAGFTHIYHICFEGCLSNFEIGDDVEASKLYPEVNYTTAADYLKIYL